MDIRFSADAEPGMVRITCGIGTIDVPLREARRCHDYLAAEHPHGVFRVRGHSADIAAFWLDRTLDGHLIVHAAPTTSRTLDAVAIMPADPERGCSLYRAILTATHAQQRAA